MLEGVAQLQAALHKAADLAPTALAAAGLEEMEKVMAEAKAITPIDFGILKDSGTVLPPEIHGTEVEIVAGFGGAASEYAIVQHEDLTLNHSPPGQAKFLERPFLARADAMPKALAAGVEKALKRLGS